METMNVTANPAEIVMVPRTEYDAMKAYIAETERIRLSQIRRFGASSEASGQMDKALLFRMDSGNDAAENMGILLREGCRFLIKRNLRKESKTAWLEQIKEGCQDIERPREGKAVYIGSTWKKRPYGIPMTLKRRSLCGLSMKLRSAR